MSEAAVVVSPKRAAEWPLSSVCAPAQYGTPTLRYWDAVYPLLEASAYDVISSLRTQSRSSARNQSCRLVSSTLPHAEQSAALTSQRPLAQSPAEVHDAAAEVSPPPQMQQFSVPSS